MYFSQVFLTAISACILSLTLVFGFPTKGMADQILNDKTLNDNCVPGGYFKRNVQGYGVNKYLIYSGKIWAERVISFAPAPSVIKRYYTPNAPIIHQKTINEFIKIRDNKTKEDKLTGVHIYPRPYFHPDKGMGCKNRHLDFHQNEFTFYQRIHTPRISGDLCVAEPKIIMNFPPLVRHRYAPNTLAQFMVPSRNGYFSMIEIIYSPLYRGELVSPSDFKPSTRHGSVRSILRARFQKFVKELTSLMQVQCGHFPKRIKLEGRAYAPKGKTYPDHRIFKDGTIEVLTADLHYFDKKISLDNVAVGKYGREILEYNLETIKKLVKREELKRILQEQAAARPMTVLEAYWRKAGKIDRFTASEILTGISNAVENSICNQPITNKNRGDKYAAQCQ